MNKLLTPYWIELDSYSGLASFVGVTAYSMDDVTLLLKDQLFRKEEMPRIKNLIENIHFKDLDQNHVVPNMGPITERGVWYPNYFPYDK